MNEKIVNRIWWFASIMAIIMFASYIDQIRLNINGQTWSVILPIATTINCLAWMFYWFLKTPKDWPIIVCNLLWVILWIITTFTAIYF